MMLTDFARQVSQAPDASAVHDPCKTYSYRDLDQASHDVTRRLQDAGVASGDIVAVCLPSGFSLLAAILGIFRCGAVYLPLDPEHPDAHTRRILQEAQPRIVIGDDWTFFSKEKPQWNEVPAYLMYTSGTTGAPKGVMIGSRQLDFYLRSAQDAFGFDGTDIFCNIARATFSISLFDLLLPLTVGAAVRFLDRRDIFDRQALSGALRGSTVLHAGPSLLCTLFRYGPFPALRHVSTGGDLVLPSVMEGMKSCFPRAELFVIYGTTEISCMGTYAPISRQASLSGPIVGKPFPGVRVRLHEEEIYFQGPGVGLGYFHQAHLTAECFTADGYRTGDYGRWTADGQLEMLGRRDFQVQLRGVRIELTGIENHILRLGLATHCAVVHQQRAGDSGHLLAFLAPANDRDADSVRRTLAEHLPAEMMPTRFVFLDRLPTNFNGKIDRRRMQEWPLETASEYAVPESIREALILAVLRDALDQPHLAADQDFFAAGGHSLLAIHVLSTLKDAHQIEIAPDAFFQKASARALAAFAPAPLRSNCYTFPLTSRDTSASIFFVAGAPIYRPLAQALDKRWSAFALVSHAECHPQASTTTDMEELARDYTASILQQQRTGPYYILGYSFAGILAFEIARQLTAAGHEVKRLFLLDATLPDSVFRWRHAFLQFLRLWCTSPVRLWSYFTQKGRRSPTSVDPRTADLDRDRGHRNRLCARAYMKRMPHYSGDTVLFVAGERLHRKPLLSRSCGWRPYAKKLTVITTPGDHHALIQDPACLERIVREIHASVS